MAADLDGDIPLRENLGGWLRLSLLAAVLLLLPSWLFVSAALLERMALPAIAAGAIGAVLVMALVPVPLLLLLGGAALNAAHARWEVRSRRSVDEAVDREAVMTGVVIKSRVIGSSAPADAAPRGDLASIGARLGATAIDVVLACAVAGPAGAIALAVWGSDPGVLGPPGGATLAAAGAAAVGALVVGAVQAVGLAVAGQTLGKRIVGIRIVGEDGQHVGLVDAVMIRHLAWGLLLGIPVLGWALSVADVWALLTDPAHQTLHDQLARTLVVRAGGPPST
jgi:uncharacterized RDD family membrane protein YckC